MLQVSCNRRSIELALVLVDGVADLADLFIRHVVLLTQDLADLVSLWLEKECVQDHLPGYICLRCLASDCFEEDTEVSLKPLETSLAQIWEHIADERQLSVGDLSTFDSSKQGCKVRELVRICDLRPHRLVVLLFKLLLDDS